MMKNLHRAFALILLMLVGWSAVEGQATTFVYTGGPQVFVVPQGCFTSAVIDAYGAQGGGNSVSPGGLGGHTQATIPVVGGETLHVYVGGTGDVGGTAGYNGGGTGIGGSPGNPGSGGGGASDVRKGGTSLNDRWVVAGGGGGGMENGGPAVGGAGGGLIGGDGLVGGNPWGCTPLVLPTGGTQAAGGLGGTSVSCAWNGFDGSFGLGGNSHNNYRSAGGGGGWYGGGGGHNGTSGAGGSSFAHGTATNVTHNQGTWTGNGQVVITLQQSVTVYLGPDTTVCSGYVLDAGNAGSTFAWSNGATTQTISVSNSGIYTVTVTDGFGCTGNDAVALTISTAPVVQLGADTAVCTTMMLDAGNAGSSYLWSNNDTTQIITVGAGSYSVTVTNGAGCQGIDSILVSIVSPPTVNLGGTATGCDSVLLDAGNPGAAYVWSNGGSTQQIIVTAGGTYAVTVTQIGGCQFSSSDTVVVSMGSTTNAAILGLDSAYCNVDPSVNLVGNPAGGVFSGNGVTGNTFDPSAVPLGNVTITYTFTDSLGCVSTAMAVTTVDICESFGNPFAGGLQVFPNPNNGVFAVTGFTEATEVEVIDVLGNKVAKRIATSERLEIDLRSASKGIYLLRVKVEGQWFAARVVVR
jgi:hypothetical protein